VGKVTSIENLFFLKRAKKEKKSKQKQRKILELPLQSFLLNGVQVMKLLSEELKRDFADQFALLFDPVSLFL